MMETRRVGHLSPAYTYGVGVASGLLAGIAMGVVLHFGMAAMPAVGALYGAPTAAAGWVAHLLHSALFAVVFVTVVERTPVRTMVRSIPDSVGVGLVYGAALEIVMGGLALPLMVDAVGPDSLPVPVLPLADSAAVVEFGFFLGIGHLVYGGLLGAVYGLARIEAILEEAEDVPEVRPEP